MESGLLLVSSWILLLCVGDAPVAHGMVGEEDGGLLLWLAVFVHLLRVVACRAACLAASVQRTTAALLCAERRLVAGFGGRAIEPATRTAATPHPCACPSAAPSSAAAASDCRHGRD